MQQALGALPVLLVACCNETARAHSVDADGVHVLHQWLLRMQPPAHTHTACRVLLFVVAAVCRLDQTELSRLGVHQLRRFLEALLQVSNATLLHFCSRPVPQAQPPFVTAGRLVDALQHRPADTPWLSVLCPAAALHGQRACHCAAAGARAQGGREPPGGQQEGAGRPRNRQAQGGPVAGVHASGTVCIMQWLTRDSLKPLSVVNTCFE